MKKIFMFAIAALALAACTSDDVALQQNAQPEGTPVNFDVYVPRTATRAGVAGNQGTNYGITTATIADLTNDHGKAGFGVFAYYTSNGEYDTNNSTPNFMYNQQVKHSATTTLSDWTYEPVKYWPNEYGNAAVSDDFDHVTFFAYAPWVDVTVNTGIPVTAANATPIADYDAFVAAHTAYADLAAYVAGEGVTQAEAEAAMDEINVAEQTEQIQKLNITQLTKNTDTGDPIVKYVVDTKPNTSVDLLWGVAADDATVKDMANVEQAMAGQPYINLTKQGDVTGKIKWTFKHALAMLNVQIVMAVDAVTAAPYTPTNSYDLGQHGEGTVDNFTKVFLRSIKFDGGFAMQGALNLHSETDGVNAVADAMPNWKDYDGSKELQFEPVTFFDGLKDGKEGTTNAVQKNEKPQGLNPVLLETYNADWQAKAAGVPTNAFVNLFAGSTNPTDPIYVIPSGDVLNVEVLYDVLTQDEKLSGLLSDGVTHGSAIENRIYKENVFNMPIEPGKKYTLKIILGLESVKFEADVDPWVDGNTDQEIELPKNI